MLANQKRFPTNAFVQAEFETWKPLPNASARRLCGRSPIADSMNRMELNVNNFLRQ